MVSCMLILRVRRYPAFLLQLVPERGVRGLCRAPFEDDESHTCCHLLHHNREPFYVCSKPVLYSYGFNAVVAFTECRQTDIAFAAGAKTYRSWTTLASYNICSKNRHEERPFGVFTHK